VTLDEGHYYIYFFVAISYQKVSLMALEKPGKLGEFFLLCGHPVRVLPNFGCCCG